MFRLRFKSTLIWNNKLDSSPTIKNKGYTLSERIGKVVAAHAEVARSIPGWAETAPIYTMH